MPHVERFHVRVQLSKHTHTFYRPFISTKTTHEPTTSMLSNNENEVLDYFDSEG